MRVLCSAARALAIASLASLPFAPALPADDLLQVLEVRQPESPAWGANTATITIRNRDSRAREVNIAWQSNSLAVNKGWGADETAAIAASETKTLSQDFVIPAYPGKVTHLLRIRDAADNSVLWEHRTEHDFPFANSRTNPLRFSPKLQNAIGLPKSEFPRLRMQQRGPVVIYFLEGDAYVESRIDEIAAERTRIYRELAARINPAFDQEIAVYLFPDAASKRAYTNHQGMGWAVGRILVEIFNAQERIDPYHEVTHIIAGSIGDPPALFNEGLAAWSQQGHLWDGIAPDSWAKAFAARDVLWPLEKLIAFREIGSTESRGPIAYPQAASVVGYLVERYGWEKFLTAYRTLKRNTGAEGFREIFGATVAEVEKAWLAKLASPDLLPAPDAKVAAILAQDPR